VIAAGGAVYYVFKKKSNRKKRRARKAGNGARLEVVVVAGSPAEPMTRSIALDLERRGFIVYIVCNGIEEEVMVQNESRPDIKPLMIDIVDVSSPLSVPNNIHSNKFPSQQVREHLSTDLLRIFSLHILPSKGLDRIIYHSSLSSSFHHQPTRLLQSPHSPPALYLTS
jgi:hypothetical protein